MIIGGKILKLLVLLAIVLFIVAISSFWFSEPSFRESDVTLDLEGPIQISSGQEATYKITYTNNTRSTLQDLNFVFFYPDGSVVLTDTGIEEEHIEDFNIEELSPGERGEKELSAYLIGEKGNIRTAKVVWSFKAGNLRSSFEKTENISTTIVDTPIPLTLLAPPSANSESGINYILDYRNTSDEDIVDLLIEFDYPDGFTPSEFEPQPTSGNNVWLIKSLKRGSGGRISLGGLMKGKEGESKVAQVVLKRKVNGEYVDYQKSSASTIISNPVLGLEILVNSSNDYAASLGDRLNYSIRYRNNSNINFSGMNLSVKLEGDMFDIGRLDTRGGFYDDSTRTITWNSSTVSDFSNFFPNTVGVVDFSAPLKSSFPSSVPGASNDRFVKVVAKLSTSNVPLSFGGNEVAVSNNLITKIGTQPSFNQAVYYNDSDFGSFGPLPLRVGEETAFTVRWQLSNPGNDTENVKVAAKVSPGTMWGDLVKATEGQSVPTFNPNSFEVSWNLSKLPYGTGVFFPKYEAAFRLKVRPSSTQVGGVINLLDGASFTGNDSFTKQSIIINKGVINTNNLVDRPREGVVQ